MLNQKLYELINKLSKLTLFSTFGNGTSMNELGNTLPSRPIIPGY